MAVKRRIVWFSDEEWVALQEKARRSGFSVSELLRRLGQPSVRPYTAASAPDPATVSTALAQAERDAILRRVNRKGSGA